MTIARRRLIAVEPSELRAAFKSFRPALGGMRPQMIGATVLALLGTALELLRPWPITWVIDHLVASPDPSTIKMAPVVIFALVAFIVPVLVGVSDEQLQLVVARVSRKATVRIRSDVFEHIHRLEFAEHQRQFSGDLLMRLMGDVNMIRDLLFPSWVTLLQHGSLLIGGVVVFGFVDLPLLAVALIPLPFLAFNVKRSSAKVKQAAGKQRKKEGAIASRAAESIRQVGIIKAFSAETRTANEFRGQARSAERATMLAARLTARMSRTTEFLTGAGIGLVLIVGAMRVRSGLVSPGELVLAISYTRTLYKPVKKLTGEGARLAKATACALRVQNLLDKPSEDPMIGRPTPPLGGDIEFIGVSTPTDDVRCRVSPTEFPRAHLRSSPVRTGAASQHCCRCSCGFIGRAKEISESVESRSPTTSWGATAIALPMFRSSSCCSAAASARTSLSGILARRVRRCSLRPRPRCCFR
jgi:ATP-binding cassette, subfamily B, bacterial